MPTSTGADQRLDVDVGINAPSEVTSLDWPSACAPCAYVERSSIFSGIVAASAVPWASGLPLAQPRPLLLLVGDTLDAATPRLLRRLDEWHEIIAACFLPVAVERLEQPALAREVRLALAVNGDAGLPAVAVAVPDGSAWRIAGALTASAVDARALLAIAASWSETPEDLLADARQLAGIPETLRAAARADARPLPRERHLDLIESAAIAQADPLIGGFGLDDAGAPLLPRLPQAVLLRFLALRAARPDASPGLVQHLGRAATALIAGAVHDQLAGGFHRAASDPHWCLPRFEKRLADQAQIASALLAIDEGGLAGPWRAVAERTVRWALTALARDDGWLAAGTHAIDQHGEGACFTWTREELDAVLGREAGGHVATRFGVGDELTAIPGAPGRHALAIRSELDPRFAKSLPGWVRRLEVARAERPQPPRDERVDLAAHGMLLEVLAKLRDAPGFADVGAALAQRLTTIIYPDWRDAAWVAIGLTAWRGSSPGTARDPLARADAETSAPVARGPGDDLDPIDDEDGPSEAALAAWALLTAGQPERAAEIIVGHAGTIRRAGAATAGLALIAEMVS